VEEPEGKTLELPYNVGASSAHHLVALRESGDERTHVHGGTSVHANQVVLWFSVLVGLQHRTVAPVVS
jgi:hypothetical protein